MSAPELAERLGHESAWIYENYDRLVAAGMPRALTPVGRKKWNRALIEPWLVGQTKGFAAANDPVPLAPGEIDWDAIREAEYGASR